MEHGHLEHANILGNFRKGFTLYETLVYLGLFFMLAVLVVGLVLQLLKGGFRLARAREVSASASNTLDAMRFELRHAQRVYTPTSLFSTTSSQITIETNLDAPWDEETSFTDFYLDGGRIYAKQEGSSPMALTGNGIFIDAFRATLLNPVPLAESVRINLQAHNRFSQRPQDSAFSVTATAAIRRW